MFRSASVLLFAFTVITGVAYPAFVTTAAGVLFPAAAQGSLIEAGGEVRGSSLIGQPFTRPGYFWPRPSATATPYDASASSGSNLGPTNPALREAVAQRVATLRAADPDNTAPVPVDLVTSSASGLDPHVSPAAALYQVGRVAKARGLGAAEVRALVLARVEPATLGVLGEPRVNVLALNLALDALAGGPAR
jgi:potassium-transporting ATPase KdpC subunit